MKEVVWQSDEDAADERAKQVEDVSNICGLTSCITGLDIGCP